MKGFSLRREFPNYFQSYDGLKDLNKALADCAAKYKALTELIEADVRAEKLKADAIIEKLFNSSDYSTIEAAQISRATERVELGNPPGKRSSLGDAIHWEYLLGKAFRYCHVSIVTSDSDFSSALNSGHISAFLRDEWTQVFGPDSSVTLFTNLSDFLSRHHPEVVLSQEAVKDDLISRLSASPTFARTHEIIAELAKFSKFTQKQIRGIFLCLLENTQVGWIANDADVQDFYLQFENSAWLLPDSITEAAAELLNKPKDFFSLPF